MKTAVGFFDGIAGKMTLALVGFGIAIILCVCCTG
jgi:hypothetical protein